MSLLSTDWRETLLDRMRAEARPVEKLSHQARLYALTQAIAAASPSLAYDDDVVYAAAWVHDLGVFEGRRPDDPALLAKWDSTAYTVSHGGAVLLHCGFPAEKVEAVIEAIRTHEPHGVPATTEAVLLRDADLLEQLGAVAVMRTTAKIGRDTRFRTFADAAAALRRALESVPGKIMLPAAKALAEPRIEALRSFLQSLERESSGHLA